MLHYTYLPLNFISYVFLLFSSLNGIFLVICNYVCARLSQEMFSPCPLSYLFSPSLLPNKHVDQQKKLRLIYDKFKEEVNLHLQDCRSTVEDLEADQIETKGALEKQSMRISTTF